jgi:hypothetical protein
VTVRRWALPVVGVLTALAMSGFAAPSPSAPAGAPPSLAPLRTPAPVGGVPEGAGAPSEGGRAPSEASSAPPVENLVPGVPPEQLGEDDGAEWLILGGAVISAGLAAGYLVWTRRRGGRSGPAWTPAYADARGPAGGAAAPSSGTTFSGSQAGPVPAGYPPIPAGERELTEVLRRLAAGGASAAISQQIERLLSRPDVDRDALVQAVVHYRDQLAGTGWEHELLTALNAAGINEIRAAEGEIFDGRSHEAVDSVAGPTPQHHDRIAQTVRCGYLDHDRVLRPPRVVVYRADGPA